MKLLYKEVLLIAVGKYSSGDLKTTISKENTGQLSVNARRHIAYFVEVFYQLLTHVRRWGGRWGGGALFQLFSQQLKRMLYSII